MIWFLYPNQNKTSPILQNTIRVLCNNFFAITNNSVKLGLADTFLHSMSPGLRYNESVIVHNLHVLDTDLYTALDTDLNSMSTGLGYDESVIVHNLHVLDTDLYTALDTDLHSMSTGLGYDESVIVHNLYVSP